MEVVKVLGSERCYLMSDGSKIPFSEKHRIFGNKGLILKPAEPKIIVPEYSFKKKKKKKSE